MMRVFFKNVKAMKIKRITVVIVGLLSLTVQAVTMQDLFLTMPSTYLPTLPLSARQDLVDFYTNNRIAAMPAAFSNQMVLKNLSDDYLLLQTSPSSSLQIKRLPLSDTASVLALIHTVQGPLEESRLVFCSLDWKQLTTFSQPILKPSSFLANPSDSLALRFDADCVRLFVRWAGSPGTTDMRAMHSLALDVPAETMKPYEGMLMDTLRLKWTGQGYEPAFNKAPVTGHNSTVSVRSEGTLMTTPN